MGGARECRGRSLARRALYDSYTSGPGFHSNVFASNSICAKYQRIIAVAGAFQVDASVALVMSPVRLHIENRWYTFNEEIEGESVGASCSPIDCDHCECLWQHLYGIVQVESVAVCSSSLRCHLTHPLQHNARTPCMSKAKHRHRVKRCSLRFTDVNQRNGMEPRMSKGQGEKSLLYRGQIV
jgi:hypothetical protein